MKKYITLSLVLLFFCQCTDQEKTKVADNSMEIKTMLENYYQDNLKMSPMEATMAGDNRFNDQFPNLISRDYLDRKKNFYQGIKEKIAGLDRAQLSDNDQLSIDVLEWECDIALGESNFQKELLPVDQMWTTNLRVGQLASGASAQPFKTVKDYEDWLSRVNGYVDPQFADLAKGPV